MLAEPSKDYYPFGMQMPGSTYNSGDYTFGFQGQEHDDEVAGAGNSTFFKYRMHDPRTGRFYSIDPLFKKYPFYSQYAFSGNRVIDAVELEGLEPVSMIDAQGKLTTPMISVLNAAFGFSKSSLQNSTWVPYTKNITTRAWGKMVGMPKNIAASVMGTTVVHNDKQNRSDRGWFALIAHEQSHEADIESQGNISFYFDYGTEGALKGYRGITTEQDAYKVGDAAGGGYAGKLFNYQNGLVSQTLNDPSLTDAQKSSILESTGSKFRRDVILQDQINSNNATLQATQNFLKNTPGLSKQDVDFNKMIIKNIKNNTADLRKEQMQITRKYGL